MKLLTFDAGSGLRLGALLDVEQLVDLDHANQRLGAPEVQQAREGRGVALNRILRFANLLATYRRIIGWRNLGPRGPESVPLTNLGRVQGTLIKLAAKLGVLP